VRRRPSLGALALALAACAWAAPRALAAPPAVEPPPQPDEAGVAVAAPAEDATVPAEGAAAPAEGATVPEPVADEPPGPAAAEPPGPADEPPAEAEETAPFAPSYRVVQHADREVPRVTPLPRAPRPPIGARARVEPLAPAGAPGRWNASFLFGGTPGRDDGTGKLDRIEVALARRMGGTDLRPSAWLFGPSLVLRSLNASGVNRDQHEARIEMPLNVERRFALGRGTWLDGGVAAGAQYSDFSGRSGRFRGCTDFCNSLEDSRSASGRVLFVRALATFGVRMSKSLALVSRLDWYKPEPTHADTEWGLALGLQAGG